MPPAKKPAVRRHDTVDVIVPDAQTCRYAGVTYPERTVLSIPRGDAEEMLRAGSVKSTTPIYQDTPAPTA